MMIMGMTLTKNSGIHENWWRLYVHYLQVWHLTKMIMTWRNSPYDDTDNGINDSLGDTHFREAAGTKERAL